VPEVVSGIIVTRKGKGDMAISNSIGSNIFDILICLGLPWFISTVIIDSNQPVKIYSGGIIYSAAILLSTVVVLIVSFMINKWKLNKLLGIIMIILWVIVTTITCLFELDVFGKFSIPYC
jgi:Ca2+/Na+ antiporter